jgi:hypothetical protein
MIQAYPPIDDEIPVEDSGNSSALPLGGRQASVDLPVGPMLQTFTTIQYIEVGDDD